MICEVVVLRLSSCGSLGNVAAYVALAGPTARSVRAPRSRASNGDLQSTTTPPAELDSRPQPSSIASIASAQVLFCSQDRSPTAWPPRASSARSSGPSRYDTSAGLATRSPLCSTRSSSAAQDQLASLLYRRSEAFLEMSTRR